MLPPSEEGLAKCKGRVPAGPREKKTYSVVQGSVLPGELLPLVAVVGVPPLAHDPPLVGDVRFRG